MGGGGVGLDAVLFVQADIFLFSMNKLSPKGRYFNQLKRPKVSTVKILARPSKNRFQRNVLKTKETLTEVHCF